MSDIIGIHVAQRECACALEEGRNILLGICRHAASECTMVTSVFLRAGQHVIGDFQPNAHSLIIVR